MGLLLWFLGFLGCVCASCYFLHHQSVFSLPSIKAVRVLRSRNGKIPPQAFSFCTEIRHVLVENGVKIVGEAAWRCCRQLQIVLFFPRVRTPCGHGAQVIVEGREEQSDGGERNEDPKTNQTKHPSPQAETPPSCSLSSTLGETCETETSGIYWA